MDACRFLRSLVSSLPADLWRLVCHLHGVVVGRDAKTAGFVAAGMVLAAALSFVFNDLSSGTAFGIYGTRGEFELPGLSDWIYQLVSPSRGLLWFVPWTILVIPGLIEAFKGKGRETPWIRVHLLFVVGLYLVYASRQTIAGWSSGPRFQADYLLSATLIAGPVIERSLRRPLGIALLVALFIPGFFFSQLGARQLSNRIETKQVSFEQELWNWRFNPLSWWATNGRIERAMRRESRPPVWGSAELDVQREDLERFFESGLAPRPPARPAENDGA